MGDLICYDSAGRPLKALYQWDTGQKVLFSGIPTDPLPQAHFCNKLCDKAYVVTPEVEGNRLAATVPDKLLQQDESIIAYIYQQENIMGIENSELITITDGTGSSQINNTGFASYVDYNQIVHVGTNVEGIYFHGHGYVDSDRTYKPSPGFNSYEFDLSNFVPSSVTGAIRSASYYTLSFYGSDGTWIGDGHKCPVGGQTINDIEIPSGAKTALFVTFVGTWDKNVPSTIENPFYGTNYFGVTGYHPEVISSFSRTVDYARIPVIPRSKPGIYTSANDMTYTTIEQVDSRIRATLLTLLPEISYNPSHGGETASVDRVYNVGSTYSTVSAAMNQWKSEVNNGDHRNTIIYKPTQIPTHIYYVNNSFITNNTTEFPTLIDAVSKWVSDGKPCATIYVDSGVYITQNDPSGASNPLTIKGSSNRLTIIGADKNNTIIKSTTGKYVHPAINVQGGNVSIKNMTFIADHSTNPDFTYREKSGYNSAYAVHCDGGSESDVVPGVIEFDNCNMWSWQSCGLGCGTVQDGHLIVRNCDIRSYTEGYANDPYQSPSNNTETEEHAKYVHGERGAIVYHSSPKTKGNPSVTIDQSNESFTLVNCNVYMHSGYRTVKLPDSEGSGKSGFFVLITFIDNTFCNGNINGNTVGFPNTSYDYRNKLSAGNNISTLNSAGTEVYSLTIK